MAVITTGSHPKLLWPGIKAIFGTSYNEYPAEYPDLFEKDTSEKNYEEDVQVKGLGLAPVKAEGQGISYDAENQGYTKRYTHLAYALGVIWTKEEMDDNLYWTVGKRRVSLLGMSMRQTLENVGANVYNRAFDTNYTGGDGKAMCVSDHPSDYGTWSNVPTTAADLSEASLEDACIQIEGYQDDRGLRIAIKPRKLIIPRQEMFNATRILKSALQSGTVNNDTNALRSMNALPDGFAVNHFLTDADAWFIRTNQKRGPVWFERVAVAFDQDNDFDTKNLKAAAYMRHAFGWTDPKGIWGSAGA
jgi:hypothetical protein